MILVLVVFINLPAAHSTWQRWKVERSGVETTATVVQTEQRDGGYWLSFQYPPGTDLGDVEGGRWPAHRDRATWEEARSSGEIGERYLEDRVSAYEVDGPQVPLGGAGHDQGSCDLILLAIVLLAPLPSPGAAARWDARWRRGAVRAGWGAGAG